VQNYGGSWGGGSVSLTEATVWSYNTAYARLMMDVGPAPAVDMATRLGVQSPLQPLPPAVLGTENVTVLDMASAYATFANRGQQVAPVLVSRITRADGSVLYENHPTARPVLPTDVADQMNWVLRQVIQRGTGTAARLDRPAAGKTGTAEGYRDAWFVGYTPDLAAAVWVGFAQNQTAMVYPTTPIQVTGGSWPSEIWQRFMSAATAESPVVEFTDPEPATLRKIEASRRPITTLPPLESTTSSSAPAPSESGPTSSSAPTSHGTLDGALPPGGTTAGAGSPSSTGSSSGSSSNSSPSTAVPEITPPSGAANPTGAERSGPAAEGTTSTVASPPITTSAASEPRPPAEATASRNQPGTPTG
jgi:penicillin-binding protein 1A